MVCRLLLVSLFTGCKNGWLMCQVGLSEGLTMAQPDKAIHPASHCHCIVLSMCSDVKKIKRNTKYVWTVATVNELIAVCHPSCSMPRKHYLLVQFCTSTKGWSPKTELPEPASGHFKGICLRFILGVWIKHEASLMPSAIQQHQDFIATRPKLLFYLFIYLFSQHSSSLKAITQSKVSDCIVKNVRAPRPLH